MFVNTFQTKPPAPSKMDTKAALYPCVPTEWLWMPKPLRMVLGYLTMVLFVWTFLSPVLCGLLLFPAFWTTFPTFCRWALASIVLSFILPKREWLAFRKLPQLWYELLDFSCNLSDEDRQQVLEVCEQSHLILAMHPHGIVPYQAMLWSAYSDQCLHALYGFGAAADIAEFVPFLRNVLAWVAATSASYASLKAGLLQGKVPAANAIGRRPRHLAILPGGVAEVFTSTPGRHAIIFRKGLVRLAIETNALLVPCYVFGGTDFFYNLATSDGLCCRLSRHLRAGCTVFFGPCGLPMPFLPRVSMVIGKPIPIPSVLQGAGERDPQQALAQQIEELHGRFLEEMMQLFDKYKAAAGYPDAVLEILEA